jgi:uncharacterized protein with PQ loop repeat
MIHHHLRKKENKTPLDRLLYFFVFVTPLFELPQAVTIFTTKSAENVSIYTWSFFLISSVAWLIYGIRNRIWPIKVTYCIYLVIESIIVVGIVTFSN